MKNGWLEKAGRMVSRQEGMGVFKGLGTMLPFNGTRQDAVWAVPLPGPRAPTRASGDRGRTGMAA